MLSLLLISCLDLSINLSLAVLLPVSLPTYHLPYSFRILSLLTTLAEFGRCFPLSLDSLVADNSRYVPEILLAPLDSLGVCGFSQRLWILSAALDSVDGSEFSRRL
jgi:hypothetical protein